MRYDVMIIGGGPGGYTAALKAAKNGLNTILFEKDKIGGTCLNRGCIPMKALIESARLYQHGKHSELFGISSEPSFDYEKIEARRDEVVNTLRTGIEKQLKAAKVETVMGEAKITAEDKVTCNGETYEGDNIIIATGSVTAKPPLQGIELCITSDDVLERKFKRPESLIIIGGGVIGCEIADALNALGTRITIVEMAERLIPTMDKELSQRLNMFFRKKGIESICQARVSAIKENGNKKIVYYQDKNGNDQEAEAEEVLIATGRKANVAELCANDIGLKIERGVVHKDGKTDIDNIYVLGDAGAGNIQLAHFAEAQGENILDMILGKEITNDLSVIPSGIYTDPEIASVGATEEELKAQNKEYRVSKLLTGANGRCLIENSESGFVKLIICDDVIVGGQIITPHATELIGELAIAVQKKMSAEEFGKVIHPHPTISEMMWEAAK